MMRTYELACSANSGKLSAIAQILPHWQRGMVHVQYLQVGKLKAGQQKLGWVSTADLPHYLSARQWKSVVNQVNSALSAWQESAKSGVRELIRNAGGIEEGLRIEMFRINARKAWWTTTNVLHDHEDEARRVVVSAAAIGIVRDLIATWLRSHPFPNLSRVRTMVMDGPIATVTRRELGHADYWVRISTLIRGRPVWVPLHRNRYFDSAAGEVRNFCQVRVSESGDVSFALVKKSADAVPRNAGERLGLDWGMVTVFATSDGRLLGRGWYTWLQDRDRELMELTKALQANGVKPSNSKRFRRMQARIRAFVRNEIGRVLNRLAAEDIKTLVVERLRFRAGRLSPRMNRLLVRAGRAAVRAKLVALTEVHGVEVVEVNPAYSSVTCTGCGFVAAGNRSARGWITCGFCGKCLNADIGAARNILRRSQDPSEWSTVGKEKILARLDRDFHTRWGVDATELRERFLRGRSTAVFGSGRRSTVEVKP